MEEINYSDISVVVQGPVIGRSRDENKKRYTHLCIESIRKILPGAKIILSTWRDSETEGLDYDLLIENDDPGISSQVCDTPNGFREIVSSINGLKKCTTKYAIKTRSDLLFEKADFLGVFTEFNGVSFDNKYKILRKRVVVSSSVNPRRGPRLPFFLTDWFFFGLTEDLVDIFDIPLTGKKWLAESDLRFSYNKLFTIEQYIWASFIGKYRKISIIDMNDISNDNIEVSERYIANNCIFLPGKKLGINWLKHPGHGCAEEPCLGGGGLYTFNEYKQLLNQYSGANLQIASDYREKIIYTFQYNTRSFINGFIWKKIPRLRAFIAFFVNGGNQLLENKKRIEAVEEFKRK